MAYATIVFENPLTGSVKPAPVGFSWTVFFLGFFPPLLRGDFKWAVLIIVLNLVTFGLAPLYFIFAYNRLYIKDLIAAGYQAKSVEGGSITEIAQKLNLNIPQLGAG